MILGFTLVGYGVNPGPVSSSTVSVSATVPMNQWPLKCARKATKKTINSTTETRIFRFGEAVSTLSPVRTARGFSKNSRRACFSSISLCHSFVSGIQSGSAVFGVVSVAGHEVDVAPADHLPARFLRRLSETAEERIWPVTSDQTTFFNPIPRLVRNFPQFGHYVRDRVIDRISRVEQHPQNPTHACYQGVGKLRPADSERIDGVRP